MSAHKTRVSKSAALLLMCCVAILCALFGCSRETPIERATQEKILLVGNAADPATLDPALAMGVAECRILNAIYEGLTRADTKTLEPLPASAKSWKISADKKTYTFQIDENAKWSDGSKVSAHDFLFAWRRAVNPALGAEYASLLFAIKNAKKINLGEIKEISKLGVKAISDNILEVELEKPLPYFLKLLYHPVYFPVNRTLVKKFNAELSRDGKWTRPEHSITNGAFSLTKWSINNRVSVRKNPHWRKAKDTRLNGVDFFPISNINTEDRAFRAGQLHITESISPVRIKATMRDMPNALRKDEWLGVYYYIFNTRKAPFNNPKVCRALSMSIDRRAIIETFLKAGQKEAFNFIPPNCENYKALPQSLTKENIEEAKKLLAEAGYPNGENFPSFRIVYNTSEQHKPIAEAIQQMWQKNLGIKAELFNMSWPAYLDARRNGDFEVMRASWIADFCAPEAFLEIYQSSSGLNHTGFSNSNFDKLLQSASNAKTKEERFAFLAQAEKILMDSSPIMPIYFYTKVYLISDMIKNWNTNPLNYINFSEVDLENKNAK